MNEKEKLAALLADALELGEPEAMADYLLARGATVRPDTSDLININTATIKELIGVPGIGHTLAGRICAIRQYRGPFYSLEDLIFVPGMGKYRLEQIKDKICI